MALDGRWLHAQLNLAWRVVVHYARKLWPWSPRFGLVRFQENYVVEGLPPATPAWRDSLAREPGRCTGCGACDEVCPILRGEVDAVGAADFMGPRAFVVAGARDVSQIDDVRETLAVLVSPVCQGCRACDVACPEVIPITALARGLDAQRAVIAAARAGTMPLSPDAVRGALGSSSASSLVPSEKKEA